MDKNLLHHTIGIGSPEWVALNAGLVIAFLVLFLGSWKLSDKGRTYVGYFMACILGANFIANQWYAIATHTWKSDVHLPFHLCSFSEILAITLLLTRKQWVYEFLIFWSAGAIHSFLTPEVTEGSELFNLWEYGIAHGMVIVTAFYATARFGLKPREMSWLKVFGYTQLTLPVIGCINWLLGSNYMFIAQKPNAQNPLIIGDWPWYIVGLEFVVLAHFFAFYHIHRGLSKIHYRMQPQED